VACPWLIKKCVDADAEFLFVPTDEVTEVAEREGAIPYYVKAIDRLLDTRAVWPGRYHRS